MIECMCKVVRLLSLVQLHKWRLRDLFSALDRNEDGLVELVEFDRLFALYNANASIAASHLLQNEAEGLLLDQEIQQLEEVNAHAAACLQLSKCDLQELEMNAAQPDVCAELAEKQNARRQPLSLAHALSVFDC